MLVSKYFQATDRAKVTCYFVAWAALAILAIMTVTVREPLLYDEPIYLKTVETFEEYGLSFAFLRNLAVPTGPLYTVLHSILAPLTNLEVPKVRLVNIILLGLIIILTSWIGKLMQLTAPSLWALSMISIPMTWVLAGMALTEIPAIFFMTLGFLLLVWSTHYPKSQESSISLKKVIAAIAGGLAMGIAIAGRQPLLVNLAAVPILAIDSRSRIQVVSFLIAASVIPIILIITWGGLVPPNLQMVGEGFSINHLVLSYCYAGAISLILSPNFFNYSFKTTLSIGVVSMLLNSILGWVEFVPMATLSNQFIPESLFPIYIKICSGLLLSLGILYLASILKNMVNNREQLHYVFFALATIFICFTAVKVTHQFSSRYVAQALPLFILITEPYSQASYFKASRIVLGSVMGIAILSSYYFG